MTTNISGGQSLRPGCQQGRVPSAASREGPFLPHAASRCLLAVLGSRWPMISVFTWPSSLCLHGPFSVCVSTLSLDLGPI